MTFERKFFRKWAKFFRHVERKFSFLVAQGKNLGEKKKLEKKQYKKKQNIDSFSDLSGNFSDVDQNSSCWVVRTAFYVSGNIMREKFSKKVEKNRICPKAIRTLSEIFRAGCQNSILFVQRNIFGRKKLFQNFFKLWSFLNFEQKIFRAFGRNFSVELSRLPFHSSEEHFREKNAKKLSLLTCRTFS